MCMLSLSNFKRCAYFVTGELLQYENAVLSFLLRDKFFIEYERCVYLMKQALLEVQ